MIVFSGTVQKTWSMLQPKTTIAVLKKGKGIERKGHRKYITYASKMVWNDFHFSDQSGCSKWDNTLPPRRKNADVGGIGVEFLGRDGVDNGLFGLRSGPEGGKGRWVTLAESNNRSAILWIKIRYNFAQNSPHGDGGCFVQHLVSPETPSLRCPILHPLPFFLLQIRVLQWSGF